MKRRRVRVRIGTISADAPPGLAQTGQALAPATIDRLRSSIERQLRQSLSGGSPGLPDSGRSKLTIVRAPSSGRRPSSRAAAVEDLAARIARSISGAIER